VVEEEEEEKKDDGVKAAEGQEGGEEWIKFILEGTKDLLIFGLNLLPSFRSQCIVIIF